MRSVHGPQKVDSSRSSAYIHVIATIRQLRVPLLIRPCNHSPPFTESHSPPFTKQSFFSSIQCSFSSMQCSFSFIQGSFSSIQCSFSFIRCSFSSVRHSFSSIQCVTQCSTFIQESNSHSSISIELVRCDVV